MWRSCANECLPVCKTSVNEATTEDRTVCVFMASQCGAKHPGYPQINTTQEHVATLSQVLHLKTNELDQVRNFLGHDIRVHPTHTDYQFPQRTWLRFLNCFCHGKRKPVQHAGKVTG
ncbi:hypothetical protein FQN60_010569 [Etheostoma spectabile]|uniref:Uncharacterized protein n=1 Tax=Etheostoma spectabile TaxID=54343 RepID=A0A5J5CCY2_9PERO|nr:hypothetical protein FQN60_010569 [Etheostoma spectabile]